MLNMEKNPSLMKKLNALIHTDDAEDIPSLLQQFQNLLASDATDSDLLAAYNAALEEVRGMVLDLTEDLQNAHPDLMPPQILGYLNELPELRAICPSSTSQPGDFLQLKDVRPMCKSIAQCDRPDSVHTVVCLIRSYLDSHPEQRVAGYRHLLRVLENEIIAAGMKAYPSAPEASSQGLRLLSLLTSLELSFDHFYAFDLMEYSGGTFTPILPDSFTFTDTPAYLSWQLGLVWSALPYLNAALVGLFLSRMNKHLLTQIVGWLRFQKLSPALDEEDRCRLDLLEGLLDRGNDAEDDAEDLNNDPKDLLNCLYLSCAMGCHKDITYLLSEWDGWRETMADCLLAPQQLTSFTAYAVSVRLFLGVLVKLELPPTLEVLMRLYLVTASPDLTWVGDNIIFHWVREPLSERG